MARYSMQSSPLQWSRQRVASAAAAHGRHTSNGARRGALADGALVDVPPVGAGVGEPAA